MSAAEQAPIFVVGTGRSGSTVFFDIFAKHPNLAWLSSLADRYPNHIWPHRLLTLIRGSAIVDSLLGDHFGPSEAYRFWDHACPGFSNPYRDLLAEDLTPVSAKRVRASIRLFTTGPRNRFVAKFTGWPRVRLLNEIFPRAQFIDVTRNPYATACSLLEVPFWDGWRGPPNWRRGPLTPELDDLWRQENESFVALAAIEFVIVKRAMQQSRSALESARFHTVSYSDLCSDPVAVFRNVVEFCGLPWSARFESSIRRFQLVDRDDQWQSKLTVAQQAMIRRVLERAQVVSASHVDHV